jgi:predicted DNA-binding protein
MPKPPAEHDSQIAIRMPASMRLELDKIARRERRKTTQVVRIAIEDYLANYKK